ncbi:unnamed protein product [Ranitomeya imitator]|uniref:Uncharacterized protein n=1 Tax=Ranitomeya imitator TaxID=111125 RepID=A0ABN9M5F0_9NEOB|nr:unnamed protein product [Ranitomeya imitator]
MIATSSGSCDRDVIADPSHTPSTGTEVAACSAERQEDSGSIEAKNREKSATCARSLRFAGNKTIILTKLQQAAQCWNHAPYPYFMCVVRKMTLSKCALMIKVLDAVRGIPAAKLSVKVHRQKEDKSWDLLSTR